MHWLDTTIPQMVDVMARRFAARDLLTFSGGAHPAAMSGSLTYARVHQMSLRMAAAMHRLGIGCDDRVAIWMPNCLEWPLVWFAAARLGACVIPVNTRFRAPEVEYILNQSDATVLVCMDRFLKVGMLDMLGEFPRPPRMRFVICLGEREFPGTYSLHRMMEEGGPDLPPDRTRPDDIAMVQYTSGSTSFPKGAMLRHGALINNGWVVGCRWLVGADDTFVGGMPLYHNGGSVFTLMPAITSGARVALLDAWNTARCMEIIEQQRCTVFPAMDTMVNDILSHPQYPQKDLSSLRLISGTGLPEYFTMVHERFGVEVANVYGLTEASPNVCLGDLRDPLPKRLQWISLPQPGVEVRVVDPETGRDMTPHAVGEIWVRGWNVMAGYYNKPEETRKAIIEGGWLRTGDLGALNEEGYLAFRGRLKDMLKPGGENVSAAEVEDYLYRHPKVQHVAIVGVPDHRMGEVPFAFIRLKPGCQATEQEIRAYCMQGMAGFKVPRYVAFLDELPMTGNMKIQKYVLAPQALEEVERRRGASAPKGGAPANGPGGSRA